MSKERIENYLRNAAWAQPRDSYQTKLDPQREQQFVQWANQNSNRIGPMTVVNDPLGDYDYRGWWNENGAKPVPQGQAHFTDKYKTPYHGSFSNESQYSIPELAPSWKQTPKGGWNLTTPEGFVLVEE